MCKTCVLTCLLQSPSQMSNKHLNLYLRNNYCSFSEAYLFCRIYHIHKQHHRSPNCLGQKKARSHLLILVFLSRPITNLSVATTAPSHHMHGCQPNQIHLPYLSSSGGTGRPASMLASLQSLSRSVVRVTFLKTSVRSYYSLTQNLSLPS